MRVQSTIPYALEYSSHPTVWVDAELDLDFPAVGPAISSPELDFIDRIRQDQRIPVTFPADMPHDADTEGPTLIKLAIHHRRSLDVPKHEIADTLGDVSVKGTTLNEPRLWRRREAGLPYNDLDGGMVYRDAAAAHDKSELMHRRGIPFGEQILGIAKLETMPTKEGVKPVAEAMRTYARRTSTKYGPKYTIGSPKLQPVVTVRSLPNSYRLWDIQSATSEERAYSMLGRSLLVSAQQVPDLVAGLNPQDPLDLQTYLTEQLPTLTGYAYGILTAAGLRQKYPHAGNMSLSLGLPDADGIIESVWSNKDHRDQAAKNYTDSAELAMDKLNFFYQKHGEKAVAIKNHFLDGYQKGQVGKHPSEL